MSHDWQRSGNLVLTSNPPWRQWKCARCGDMYFFLDPGPSEHPKPYLAEIEPCRADPEDDETTARIESS